MFTAARRAIDLPIFFLTSAVVLFSLLTLNSIAPYLFPQYFIYLGIGLIALIVFSKIDFEVISLFSVHAYIASLLFLLLPLIVGQVTRGAVRWINFGPLTIQPAEIVRPFFLLFFANYLIRVNLKPQNLLWATAFLAIPVALVLIQPSLGVAILVIISFMGVILASNIDKRYLLILAALMVALLPLLWLVLAPYQKERIVSFVNPQKDPFGAGYNSLQSVISVGSGKWLGKGLGKGAQTQLAFLPEKQTDFIFAAIAEEMGLLGAVFVLALLFLLLYRLTSIMKTAVNPMARAFIAGVFLTFLAQTVINVGMNLGLVPITGLPLPLVSAGGSSLLGVMISLGMVMGSKKNDRV